MAQVAPVSRPPEIPPAQAIHARNGMVVAQESRAARIGVEILDRGGNAVDAAVAVGFALAVTYPRAGNIGGGGFMVIHLAKTRRGCRHRLPRDRAGCGDARRCFSMRKASPIRKSRATARSPSACPGTVAGLALAHEKYGSGKFSLADLIAPAIALARNGVDVEDDIADSLPPARSGWRAGRSSGPIFLNSDGTVLRARRAACCSPILPRRCAPSPSDGPKGILRGPVAEKIATRGSQAPAAS